MISPWVYKGEVFDPTEEFLEDYVGFVYLITENETGMKYVGKKFFWKPKILPVTKTRKRRQRTKVLSDWREYFSSNKTLQERRESASEDEFTREILHLCKSKGECSYLEVKEQIDRSVLLKDDYYNGIIQCRINAKHLKDINI